jgi:DNA-directed RNA polymerase specialized sigma24 family protein
MFGIAVNKVRELRRQASRTTNDDDGALLERHTPVCSARPLDVRERIAHSEVAAEALRAVDTLDARHKAAFVLCEIEGVSGVDAAARLHVPAGTLWRWLTEARARLRTVLP